MTSFSQAYCRRDKFLEMNVTIIGSGLIGRAWAMIFASQGNQVTIYDINDAIVEKSLQLIKQDLDLYEKKNCLKGDISGDVQFQLISGTSSIEKALSNASYVQECVPENIELKHNVWANIEANINISKIQGLGSSTSCLLPKILFAKLSPATRKKCSVVHPINPPYFVSLVEICPDEICEDSAKDFIVNLMKNVGQSPVVLKKQVDGFALNRLQYPVINGAWQLVRDGVMSVEDVDTVMTKGLGFRYACVGPFETCHLNANGIEDYFNSFGSSVTRVSKEQVKLDMAVDYSTEESQEVLKKVGAEIGEKIPLESIDEARKNRDEKMVKLSQIL